MDAGICARTGVAIFGQTVFAIELSVALGVAATVPVDRMWMMWATVSDLNRVVGRFFWILKANCVIVVACLPFNLVPVVNRDRVRSRYTIADGYNGGLKPNGSFLFATTENEQCGRDQQVNAQFVGSHRCELSLLPEFN